jgi:hypothetical protein
MRYGDDGAPATAATPQELAIGDAARGLLPARSAAEHDATDPERRRARR